VVTNTDYVLDPHRRFPAPAEQIYDVLQWASSPDRDWDGTQLCVGGQSAGGNLAAAAARLAMEHGGARITLQVLHYAVLDLVTKTGDKSTPAGRAAVLRPWKCEVFETAYIPSPARRRNRLTSPAWGTNGDGLVGIAPALIVAAGSDRLRGSRGLCRQARCRERTGRISRSGRSRPRVQPQQRRPEAVDATRRMYALIADHVAHATAPGRA
jgi:acetyl esterase